MTDTQLWRDAADDIFWYQQPSIILDDSNPPFYRWYPDGVTNACFNALDLHVRDGRGEQLALIYDSPVTGTKSRLTYAELLDTVERFVGVFDSLGVSQGDRVLVNITIVPKYINKMQT